MEHSEHFELVNYYYNGYVRRWSLDRVHRVVGIWITEAEYKEITGFDYPNKE